MAKQDAALSEEPGEAPLYPQQKELCTRPLFWFLTRQAEIFNFFMFGVRLATQADDIRLTAAKALAKVGGVVEQERLENLQREKGSIFKQLRKFSRLQSENITIRSVDNFISYLAEMIQMVLFKQPDLLKSSEEIKVEEILQFSTYSDLVTFLIDRKVTRLTFSGVGELEKFLLDRTGLHLTQNEDEKALLTVAVELRNIYTHTRGLVSDVTMKRLEKIEHGFLFKKGEPYQAGFDEIVAITNNLTCLARRLDEEVARKFAIRRKHFSTFGRVKS